MPERKTLTPRRRCAVLLGAAVSALGGLSAQADNATTPLAAKLALCGEGPSKSSVQSCSFGSGRLATM